MSCSLLSLQSCLMFTSVLVDSSNADHHITLAQKIARTCLATPQLHDELYCQLIKQTSPHPLPAKSGVHVCSTA